MKSLKYSAGDIFIAKSPYSDFGTLKTRPIVVLSPNKYNSLFEDVVILSITTKEKSIDLVFEINNDDLLENKLKNISYIRLDKPASIDKKHLEHKITSLTNSAFANLKSKIKEFYEL